MLILWHYQGQVFFNRALRLPSQQDGQYDHEHCETENWEDYPVIGYACVLAPEHCYHLTAFPNVSPIISSKPPAQKIPNMNRKTSGTRVQI